MENAITTGYLHIESVSYDIPCFHVLNLTYVNIKKKLENFFFILI